jgi:hypothetical protein
VAAALAAALVAAAVGALVVRRRWERWWWRRRWWWPRPLNIANAVEQQRNCWTTYSASESRPGLAAAALAMAAILDKELYVAQQPAAAGRLVQILGMLAKRSNRRGGFLQSVRAMTPADGRGDSGGRTR